ncbi:MAG: hypothetical protein LBR45_00885 [Bacteroidales bacterium]|jgi:sulfur transfer complex TusBCD TusB component (DsrH family)|nr:hypothetical protein [Bacteroidales bacterium]
MKKGKKLSVFAENMVKGLNLAFNKMLIQKAKTGDKVVLMQDGKIVHLDPEKLLLERLNSK